MEKEKEISELKVQSEQKKKKNDTQADCVNILMKIQRFLKKKLHVQN